MTVRSERSSAGWCARFLGALTACVLPQIFLADGAISQPAPKSTETGRPIAVFDAERISPKLAFYVAEIGRAAREALPKDTDLLAEITKRCGKVNSTGAYLAIFAAANPNLKAISDNTLRLSSYSYVNFPACVFANQPSIQVPVESNGPQWMKCASPKYRNQWCAALQRPDLHGLEAAAVGFNYMIASGFLVDHASAINTMSVNRLKDPAVGKAVLNMMKAGLELRATGAIGFDDLGGLSWAPDVPKKLPSKALSEQTLNQDIRLANFHIKAFNRLGSSTRVVRPGTAAGSFSFPLGPTAIPVSVVEKLSAHEEVSKPSVVEVQAILSVDAPCEGTAESGRWPVQMDELQRILRLSAALNDKQGRGQPNPGLILVVDTGFPPDAVNSSPFDSVYFGTDPNIVELIEDSPTITLYEKFRHIIDLKTDGDPDLTSIAYIEDAQDAAHGLGVTTLALGGVKVLKKGRDASDGFVRSAQVVPAAAYRRSDSGGLVADAAAVRGGISGTRWRDLKFRIVNLSLRYVHRAGRDIGDHFKNKLSTLYVVAAGNDVTGGKDIALSQTLPAALGGRARGNVITVTAIDPSGAISKFAHYSQDYVDIAAPGCDVPIFSWDADAKKLLETKSTGTSFAAPLVSFVASLLYDELDDIARVKRRILSTADHDRRLEGKVWSRGKLNAAKALAVHLDVIETKDGELLLGRVEWPSGGQLLCNQKQSPKRRLLKLTRLESRGDGSDQLMLHLSGLEDWIVDFVGPCISGNKEIREFSFRPVRLSAANKIVADETITIDFKNISDVTFCERHRCYKPK